MSAGTGLEVLLPPAVELVLPVAGVVILAVLLALAVRTLTGRSDSPDLHADDREIPR